MAAPNIVTLTQLIGKTAVLTITTTPTTIISNSLESNKVLKVNTLLIANVDGVNNANITANLIKGGVAYAIAFTITVPADTTLVAISRETTIYLEEGDSIELTASANGDLQAICSYEEIG
jgi:hypothetical protein